MKNLKNFLPGLYKMEVKWVAGINRPDDYTENDIVWIFKLWGNPRNIAIDKSFRKKRSYLDLLIQTDIRNGTEYAKNFSLNGCNPVSAWYLPIMKWPKNFGI